MHQLKEKILFLQNNQKTRILIDHVHKVSEQEELYIEVTSSRISIKYSHEHLIPFAYQLIHTPEYFNNKQNPKCEWRIAEIQDFDDSLMSLLIGYGFNAALVKDKEEGIKLRNWGLKPIIKVDTLPIKKLPFENEYFENLKQNLNSFLGETIYWQSPLYEQDCKAFLLKNYKLKIELFLEELACIEKVVGHLPFFYAIPYDAFTLHHLKVLQQYISPNGIIVFQSEHKGKDHLIWQDRSEKAIPSVKLLEDEIPVFLPSAIERYLLRKDRKLLKGAIIQCPKKILKEGFINFHLKCVSEALWSGTSPYYLFDLLAKNSIQREWINVISSQYSYFKYLKEVSLGSEEGTIEKLRSTMEALIALWKVEEKQLDKALKVEGQAEIKQFLLSIEKYYQQAKEYAKKALSLYQLSIPPYLS